ncbi:hypothetical protein [Timonella sp. A28]|uniref:hypothetical protein n=1 Tax=Timonella sp. A28 TaxID=3442640 RepID=UPI003EBAA3BB
MPSYRLILAVGNIRPGIPAQDVLPKAAQALSEHANVEAFDLRINKNRPELVLRFTATDRTEALHAATAGQRKIQSIIEIKTATTLQRVHGRWERIG